MSGAERLTGQHLIWSRWIRPSTLPEEHVIDARSPIAWNRNQQTGCRFRHPRNVKSDSHAHPRFDDVHAGNGRQPLRHPFGCTRERHKHVGKPLALVVLVHGASQGIEVREIGDVHRHAGANHQRDRQGLAPHLPQISQEFAIKRRESKGHHHCNASGPTGCSL